MFSKRRNFRSVRGGIANLDAVIATLLNKVNAQKKHVVGSYTGNGTYGESKPNVLSFDFPFSFFWIVGMKNSNNYFYREPNNSQVVWRLAQDFLTTEYKFIGYWFSSLGNNPIYAKKSLSMGKLYRGIIKIMQMSSLICQAIPITT